MEDAPTRWPIHSVLRCPVGEACEPVDDHHIHASGATRSCGRECAGSIASFLHAWRPQLGVFPVERVDSVLYPEFKGVVAHGQHD